MKPSLPPLAQRALADLIRFGALHHYGTGYAPSELHLPELVHEPKAIKALTGSGLAREFAQERFKSSATVEPTAEGHLEHARIERERNGG